MSEQNRQQNKTEIDKRPNKILRLIIFICLLVVIGLLIWRFLFYKSSAEQLAAFNASQAIPDSQNAATMYLQLFADYNKSVVNPAFLTYDIEDITNSGPWESKDYPELANWIEKHQKPIIAKIIDASKLEKCYFPIHLPEGYDIRIQNTSSIRKLGFMVIRSANNDLAEKRINQALEKYISCIHIGRHFRQQPLAINFLVGITIEAIGLQKIRYLIMHENVTEEQLKTIETVLPDTKFNFDEYWEEMLYVENLFGKIIPQTTPHFTNLLTRFREWLANIGKPDPVLVRVKEIYLRLLAERHGDQILIALRHYKDKTGKWPEKLDEIKPFLNSKDILIEPQNNGSFIYQPIDNSFTLYGANGLTIWPLRTPQIQTQNASVNEQQTDPNME